MRLASDTTGRAECLLPGGDALVRNDSGVFLIPHAVPGDEIRFEELPRRRGSRRGALLEVLEPSQLRVAPGCPVAATCGGCSMQCVDERAQARIKSEWVHNAFGPFMTEESRWQPVAPEAGGRRRRARWWRAEGGALGFRARSSHCVVPHDACPLVHPEMDRLRRMIQGYLPEAVRSVQITALYDGMHVVLESDTDDVSRGISLPPVHDGAQYWLRTPTGTRPLGRVQSLHDCLPAGDTEILLQIGPDDFVQGERDVNARMIRLVQKWAGAPRLVADLYAGAGNLSLPLARATGCRVMGAEVRPQSVAMANTNARRLGVDAAFQVADLARGSDLSAFAGADVLILDPPRKGASHICQAMGMLLPKAVIMLSCDVAAGGRDAAILRARGYRLRALQALDMFPFSGHVEAASLWLQG